MTKQNLKKLNLIIVIIFIIIFSCTIPQTGSKTDTATVNTIIDGKALTSIINPVNGNKLPDFRYPYGLSYAHNETDAYLIAEYNDWKFHYITSSGAGGNLRVQRDKASDYDTVSEGIAYGMLLAVYFDDQATFDGLYKYAKDHFDRYGLMHWKVNKNNINVSEFRLEVPHSAAYMLKSDWDKPEEQKTYVTKREVPDVATNPDYLLASGAMRSLGSATDADVDIAAALIMAANRWRNSGTVNYAYEGALHVKAVLKMDVATSGLVKNGTLWGSLSCWNPCYFTPAWFRLYKEFITDNYDSLNSVLGGQQQAYIDKCDKVLTFMYGEMSKIDNVNGTTGLFPDWVDTSNADDPSTPGIDESVQKSSGSDRRYYLDEDEDGQIDDLNNDGNITSEDAYQMMSFNNYYDAVRVPWRLATDYSWYGDATAKKMLLETADFFKSEITTLVDGFAIDGTAWKREDRDGFNNFYKTDNGGQNHSTTYVAMNACAAMATSDTAYAKDFYDEVKKLKDDYTFDYNYYGNTVRLFSLLYLSGRFINYHNLSNFKLARKPAQNKTVGPLTIDLTYADFGVYGSNHCDFHDRAKLYNEDGSGFGKIGSGLKDSTVEDTMIVGYCSYTGDIICGLKTLRLRGPHVSGNILARGEIDGRAYRRYGTCTFVDNMNKDPGCMDFSLDMTKFQTNTDNKTINNDGSLTLDPGTFGNIEIKDRGTLNLKNGYYYFNSLMAGTDVNINCNTTNGSVVLIIKNNIDIKSRSNLTGDASKILIIAGYNNTIYIAPEVDWNGTIIAPNTSYLDIQIHGNGTANGAFIGKKVVVHQDLDIYQVDFDWDSL